MCITKGTQGVFDISTPGGTRSLAMAAKKISTGTLGLRFMQNAFRAKQLGQVEAQQARVKDEAEWEVQAEVREGWGLGSGSSGGG